LRSHRRMRSRRSEARRRPKSSMPARCRRRQSAQLNSGNSWPGYAPFIERPGVLQQARLEHFARRSAIRLSLVGTATRFPGTVPCRAHRRKQHCAPAHDPGCAIRAICSSAPHPQRRPKQPLCRLRNHRMPHDAVPQICAKPISRSQSIDSIAGQLMRGSIAPSENKHHKPPYNLPIPFNIGLLPHV
jgi:hypothetical protein